MKLIKAVKCECGRIIELSELLKEIEPATEPPRKRGRHKKDCKCWYCRKKPHERNYKEI